MCWVQDGDLLTQPLALLIAQHRQKGDEVELVMRAHVRSLVPEQHLGRHRRQAVWRSQAESLNRDGDPRLPIDDPVIPRSLV